MCSFPPTAPALTRALPVFVPGDDPAKAIFDRVLLCIRDRVPTLAHRPLRQLEPMFGDLFAEIAEITDRL